jgi:hypothetical protein
MDRNRAMPLRHRLPFIPRLRATGTDAIREPR